MCHCCARGYASLFEKINLTPASSLGDINAFLDDAALSDAPAGERLTEMTDPGDELQASHPLRDAKVVVEDIEDNPGFFRVKLFAVPHFQVEGMDVNLSLVSQMPKAKA